MASPDDREFTAQWKSLPLGDRLRIRWAVGQGQAVRDRRLAPTAVGLARKWQESVLVRNRPLAFAVVIGVCGLIGILIAVFTPESFLFVMPISVLVSIGALLQHRGRYARADRLNREIVEGRGPQS